MRVFLEKILLIEGKYTDESFLFNELASENTKESTVNFKSQNTTLESGFTLGEHFRSATQSVRNNSSSEISEGFLQYFQFSV